MIDYKQKLQQYDPTQQYQTLLQFPDHFRKGIAIGEAASTFGIDKGKIQNIVLCGMGGSAIGADIIRTYLAQELPVPVLVNRTYRLPGFVNKHTLVIAISYSGNTEETLSAFEEGIKRGAQTAILTSGGTLAARASEIGTTMLEVPGGPAPRYALGYLFPPLVKLLEKIGLITNKKEDLADVIRVIDNAVMHYADFNAKANTAVQIAEALHGMLPVIYTPVSNLEAVNVRWRNQISENSKMLAYGNVFPEMNHNEIVGWENNPALLEQIAVIAIHERTEGPRIARRMRVTLDLIRPYAGHVIEVYAEEDRLLSRIFGLICLGDWISYYLATGTDTDPYPIEKIDTLKQALSDN